VEELKKKKTYENRFVVDVGSDIRKFIIVRKKPERPGQIVQYP